jgi:CxxC-x17-CxxC domain-containing protein
VHLEVNESIMLARTDIPPGSELFSPSLAPDAESTCGILSLGILRWGESMDFVDKEVKCIDCGAEFVFTAGEQLFFHTKQFQNIPKHCKKCKARRNRGLRRPVRSETQITCAQCGLETTVPFKPTHGKPVLCRACFQKVA